MNDTMRKTKQTYLAGGYGFCQDGIGIQEHKGRVRPTPTFMNVEWEAVPQRSETKDHSDTEPVLILKWQHYFSLQRGHSTEHGRSRVAPLSDGSGAYPRVP